MAASSEDPLLLSLLELKIMMIEFSCEEEEGFDMMKNFVSAGERLWRLDGIFYEVEWFLLFFWVFLLSIKKILSGC